MKYESFAEEREQYEMWVFKRINDRNALCHYYRGHRCIPSNDENCEICYRKESFQGLGRALIAG